MKPPMKLALMTAAVSSALFLAACGGGGSSGSVTTAGNGTMAVYLTDAPACGFDAVNVSVSKVRIHQSETAEAGDGGWTDITLNPARKINLLNLSNGVLEGLGQADLPAGRYTQVRLVLADNAGSALANSVKPTDGAETALTTPSAVQSGIKLVGQFDVAAGAQADLVLDFDACKSVVQRGNGAYLLKPVISATAIATSGSISGYIDPALAASHPVINAEINGVVVKSTVPQANGAFKLSPLPRTSTGGNYAVVVTADAHATEIINNVPVTAQADTPISTSAAPLVLPVSVTATVSGTVTPVSTTPNLTFSQSAGAGSVAVAYKNVDSSTGAYSISLPLAAPLLGQYGTLPIAVTPVMTAAGKYSVTAAGTGVQPQTTTVDVNSGNFSKSFALQ